MSANYKSQIGAIIVGLEKRAPLVVAKVAHDIEAGAKMRSRVDTGQMREGWHAAQTGPLEWTVRNPVEHAIFNEYGTVRMSAQPMLGPAIEDATPGFAAAMAALFKA